MTFPIKKKIIKGSITLYNYIILNTFHPASWEIFWTIFLILNLKKISNFGWMMIQIPEGREVEQEKVWLPRISVSSRMNKNMIVIFLWNLINKTFKWHGLEKKFFIWTLVYLAMVLLLAESFKTTSALTKKGFE